MTKIKTDNKWRYVKYGYELPKKWRKEFDWMNDEEYDMEGFAAYRGRVYALSEFLHVGDMPELKGWDGIREDSYFSGVVIKLSNDGERYKIGLAMS